MCQAKLGLNSILFDQSLLHKYNIIEVGSDSKPKGLFWSFPNRKARLVKAKPHKFDIKRSESGILFIS